MGKCKKNILDGFFLYQKYSPQDLETGTILLLTLPDFIRLHRGASA